MIKFKIEKSHFPSPHSSIVTVSKFLFPFDYLFLYKNQNFSFPKKSFLLISHSVYEMTLIISVVRKFVYDLSITPVTATS
jgi:hypothetical protein